MQNRRKIGKAANTVHEAVGTDTVPVSASDRNREICLWNRKALAHIAALPADQQAQSLLALHLEDMAE
jgi:hypothetical protein